MVKVVTKTVVEIDMHRWYAIVKQDGEVIGVIGTIADDGLGLFDSVEEWEALL